MTRRVFERDFLRRLAPVYLACRARVFGHQLGPGWPPLNLEYDLLGMSDYGIGLKLLCVEVLKCKTEQ